MGQKPSQKHVIQSTPNSVSDQRLIHHIPADIVEEILSLLPVKSLLRFRCVSKSWLSLISNPDFIKTHLQKSSHNAIHTHHRVLLNLPDPPCCFDCDGYSGSELESFSLNSFMYNNQVVDSIVIPWDEFEVVDSCNGLFCIRSTNYEDLFLWNPSTRKYRKLPDSGEEMKTGDCFYGFCFDESAYDYKIVQVCHVHSDSYARVKVYSLKADSWKRIENFPACPRYYSDVGLSTFVNGKIYWAINCSTGMKFVSLDIQTEIYENIQLPFSDDINTYVILGSLLGCLGILATCFSDGEWTTGLWILKEYGVKKSWTNMVNFPRIYPYSSGASLLYMLNDGQILLVFGNSFVLRNPKDQSRKTRALNHYRKWDGVTIYVESLVSPTIDDGLGAQTKY